jgi:lysophospholipase L1-like esterase
VETRAGVHIFFAVVGLCACSSCGEPGAVDAGAGEQPSSIAVLGSSTAAGFGLSDPGTAWVARYAAHLAAEHPGFGVVNLAVPGYTTYQVLPTGTTNPAGRPDVDEAHNVTAALAGKPRAIVVNLPSNDAAFGYTVDETMKNLGVVAKAAAGAGALVWVCTSQPRDLDAEGLALLEGLRDRTQAEYAEHAIDFWTPLAAPGGAPLPEYNVGDGIHPNAEGHRLLFEQVKLAAIPAAVSE